MSTEFCLLNVPNLLFLGCLFNLFYVGYCLLCIFIRCYVKRKVLGLGPNLLGLEGVNSNCNGPNGLL